MILFNYFCDLLPTLADISCNVKLIVSVQLYNNNNNTKYTQHCLACNCTSFCNNELYQNPNVFKKHNVSNGRIKTTPCTSDLF